jgi:hypothetical protein
MTGSHPAVEPMRAQVLNANRAGKLWQRLGFVAVEGDGVFTKLEWTPARAGPLGPPE